MKPCAICGEPTDSDLWVLAGNDIEALERYGPICAACAEDTARKRARVGKETVRVRLKGPEEASG